MSIEAMKLANALNEILESFEKDGKFCKSSLIRNEFYDRLKQTLEQTKEAIEQAQKQPDLDAICQDLQEKTYAQAMRIAELEQVQKQEPVVWMYQDKSTHEVRFQKHMRSFVDHGQTYETPLYTSPPQRQPLTDEVKHELWAKALPHGRNGQSMNWQTAADVYAKSIEAAHGIKE